MASTYSAGDIINGSLRLIGMLAEGETPTAATSNDALIAMNQMIDSWSLERLMIYTTQEQIFTWPAGQLTRSLGPTGNFIGNRPFSMDDSSYFIDPATGISYGFKLINQQQYDGIAVKTVTSSYPQVMWINTAFPNIELHLYPVPTKALEFHFISAEELKQASTLATTLSFPPGYMRAFRFNLAVEFANEFGVEAPASTRRIAAVAKRNIKRINFGNDQMAMPYAITSTRQRFNVFAGNF
jgi:hypothetical protein